MNTTIGIAQHQRILVVEDSTTQAQMLKMTLEELSMDVEVAGTLAKALALLGMHTYDAIMLDLVLPDSAGLETLVSVAALQSCTPIVVMTSLEDESLGYDALKAGASDFLIKGDSSQNALIRSLRYAMERQRQSSKIYENEKRLRTTIDNSYNAFLAVDENLRVIEWNVKAEDLFGYSLREARGKDLLDLLFSPEDGLELIEELKKYLADQGSNVVNQRREVLLSHRGGRKFPAEVAFFAVEQNEAITLCTFISDITDRKDFEKHVSEFYSVVAHELRAPLTSVKGSLGLIEGGLAGDVSDEALELVVIALNSCERLVRLIGDLLDLSKFEAGKMPLNMQDLEIGDLISKAATESSGSASSAAVRIVKNVDIDYHLTADPDRLLQVLINLISNALKYSPTGGTVVVSASRPNGHVVRVSVKDDGPGIPAEGIRQLFQKFQQLQVQSGEEKGGTGLGLAISKAIVANHKGDIGVDSTVGQGATFWFELPTAS